MRIVLQRVSRASVRVAGSSIAAIEKGALLLVGIEQGDTRKTAEKAANKILGARVFADPSSKMNLDISQVRGEFLAVSQFTLAASTSKGRRPSFDRALSPEEAQPLFLEFVEALKARGATVLVGRFGAAMEVELVNDGPVTFVYEF